jgi:hypothetical protein
VRTPALNSPNSAGVCAKSDVFSSTSDYKCISQNTSHEKGVEATEELVF